MLFHLIVLICVSRIASQGPVTISSVGEYANPNFVFAVGVGSLSFENSNDCSGVSTALCRTAWSVDGTTVGLAYPSGGACATTSTSVACRLDGTLLVSNYTTVSTSVAGVDSVTVELNADSSLRRTQGYVIEYCTANSSGTFEDVVLSDVKPLMFSNTTTVPCKDGYERRNITLTCQSDASWNQGGNCTTQTTAPSTTDSGSTTNVRITEAETVEPTESPETSAPSTTDSGSTTFEPAEAPDGGNVTCIVLVSIEGVFFILCLVFVLKIGVVKVANDMKTKFRVSVGILITGSVSFIIGIILCFGVTGSETAGIVFGSLGIAFLVASAGLAIFIFAKVKADSAGKTSSLSFSEGAEKKKTPAGKDVRPLSAVSYELK